MSKWFKYALFFILIAVFAYINRDGLIYAGDAARNYIWPCSRPIKYSIGELDPRFGLSENDFREVINEAEKVWEEAAGKDLFIYEEGRGMPISLLFDERQKETLERSQLNAEISKINSQYDTKIKELKILEADYSAKLSVYENLVSDYQRRINAYSEKVDYWNKRGGAKQPVYQELTSEKIDLDSLRSRIFSTRNEINALVDQIKRITDEVNMLALKANNTVDKYNQGEYVGTEFDAALFTKEGLSMRIDIFQFENRTKLRRVLAHELGHSLGMEHNDNSQSIMYMLNLGENMTPTAEDVVELKKSCKIR